MIRPIGNKVLVLLDRTKTITESGIELVSNQKADPKFGTVVAVGAQVTEVKKDDFVQWSRWNGQEVEVDGKKYHLMKEDEIIAILEKGKKYE